VRVLPCGDAALLVEVDSLEEVLGLASTLRDEPLPGVREVVPAARTLLLRCDPGAGGPRPVAEAIRDVRPRSGRDRPPVDEVEIPVTYDGEDLAEAAGLVKLDAKALVEWHTSTGWEVAFCGFAPGFGYLVPDGRPFAVPRRSTPRTRVPPGSVGLAGEFSGVYPRESPGGWQLIGRTERPVFDLDADPPALLRPGVRVRFRDAG
jgi:KipI family sensor histidine kinase inhibitor